MSVSAVIPNKVIRKPSRNKKYRVVLITSNNGVLIQPYYLFILKYHDCTYTIPNAIDCL